MFGLHLVLYGISANTVKSVLTEAGWTSKQKRRRCGGMSNQEGIVEWCVERLDTGDIDFGDVIFTDEWTVQLESHRHSCNKL